MTRKTKIIKRGLFFLVLTLILTGAHVIKAQQVDIGISESTTTPGLIEINMRPDFFISGALTMTNIAYTVRWKDPSVVLSDNFISPYNLQPQGPPVLNGGYYYQVYVTVPFTPIGTDILAGEERLIASFTFTGGGCTSFEIINDAWTYANNADVYFELQGLDKTGIIYEPIVSFAGFQVNLLDSDGNHLAGGSLEYREGGPNGWDPATEISDGVFCIDTERTRVGLRMTYSPQVLKVARIPTSEDYTFQMEEVTVELTDGTTLVDGGVVTYSSLGWFQFGSGTTGDDGSGIVTMDMLPTVYSFRMDYDGMHKFKQQVISASDKLVTFDISELKTASTGGIQNIELTTYPNPFSENPTIAFSLDEAREVNISVYDQTGRLIETCLNGLQTEGDHKITWDADRVNKGFYFVQLRSDGRVINRKLVKL